MTANNLHVPRERDEQILLMLRLRTIGYSPREIGNFLGKSHEDVHVATYTIKSADLYESGETDAEAGYWS